VVQGEQASELDPNARELDPNAVILAPGQSIAADEARRVARGMVKDFPDFDRLLYSEDSPTLTRGTVATPANMTTLFPDFDRLRHV
jgi:hypothetical protein